MVQHANNIEKADLDYSIDIVREAPGGDLNSNSVVASVLHSVGLNLTTSFPDGVSRSDAPLYGQLQYMSVDDALFGTANNDRIMGGVGYDRSRVARATTHSQVRAAMIASMAVQEMIA
ncbi:hypothetical protein AAII07_57260 [Microvirga sp. 0TCS3.31]